MDLYVLNLADFKTTLTCTNDMYNPIEALRICYMQDAANHGQAVKLDECYKQAQRHLDKQGNRVWTLILTPLHMVY